ncbi:MAG: 2-amino-4-hydroxy-6-hydroxymethyldihydropteridine diphosphokinase [Clostridia bacterium]|nr:2-amino-4-hydroxy-6-hydroxymethyldihydropteridine diphosphokinase [Clostridia bacterium]
MHMLLGLGANLGHPVKTLQAALAALDRVPGITVCRRASFYRTAPVGYTDQPAFTNTVAEIDTTLSPAAVLGACLGIEAALGRERTFRNAPRVVDIDLLLADGAENATPELTLPHPRLHERAFVLVPMNELYPGCRCYGYDFSADLQAVDATQIFEKLTD